MTGTQSGLKTKVILWLASNLPSCEAITLIVSESHERPLSFHERLQKRLHMLICEWCRRYEWQLRMMRLAVRAHAEDVDTGTIVANGLSEEARDRMKRALKNSL